jgi:glucose/arabinose dehydrogenase
MRTPLLSFLALFIGLSVYGSKAATSVKWRFAAASIQLEQVVSGRDQPLYVTNAGDGSNRLFIVEKPGRIKVLQPGSATPTLFLDITQRVSTDVERGLLCLAFYPHIEPNRRFFVSYTRQSDGALVIAQYGVSNDANVADPTETVILTIPQLTVQHHSGMLAFGPDGYLYIGAGDSDYGNDPNNFAQNVNELRGKILRIDIDHPSPPLLYSSPPSNPFFGSTQGAQEIFAWGFRNPWRFSFDRASGQLYLADVGQDTREEIDLVNVGGNYGWRVYEGTYCTNNDPALCDPSNFVFPIAEYGHTFGRCAIIGGYAYHGTQSTLPSGAYVFGDLCTGEIFMLGSPTSSVLLDTTLSIDSFGEDEAGEIYVVDINGSVQRIVGSLASTPPVAKCKNVTVAAGANC